MTNLDADGYGGVATVSRRREVSAAGLSLLLAITLASAFANSD